MWRVRRAERHVEEKGAIGTNRLQVADPAYRVANQVFADVVSILRQGGRADVVIILGQLWVELIGFALQKAVETIEALLERPVIVRSRG